MKNRFISILVIPFLFGCQLFGGYKVTQEVATNRFDQYERVTYLKTIIWHNGDVIKAWYDDIEKANDSIKVQRKAEASVFIEKCKRLEK